MIRTLFFVLLVSAGMMYAQVIKPVHSGIRVEVLSQSINETENSLQIQMQITCQASEQARSYALFLERIPARLSVVSASLNGESLWLIRASSGSTNENVLSWDFVDDGGRLNLYPYNWGIPYVLDLQLQSNFSNMEGRDDAEDDRILLEADLVTGLFSASPVGRGDKIELR